MRLFGYELYKIAGRRITRISLAAIFLMQIFCFFGVEVSSERAVVDGKMYRGFAAIAIDRAITWEYAGELTDDKVAQMVGRYGLLKYDREGNLETNYLRSFLYENGICDGYRNSFESYQSPTRTIPIHESPMGMCQKEEGITPALAYVKGWKVFDMLLSSGAVMTCIFLIIALSPIFADEYSSKTANVLLTTVYGKDRGIIAKIAAAFVIAEGTYFLLTAVSFLLCGICYGFGGMGSLYGYLNGCWYHSPRGVNIWYLPIGRVFLLEIAVAAQGILMLTAFVLFASAAVKRTFTGLAVSGIFYLFPAIYLALQNTEVIRHVFVMRRLIICMPLYACFGETLADTLWINMYWYRGICFVGIFLPSLFLAYDMYRNHQAR